MSLSTWLRDYLFIPLGGSRGSPWVVRKNLMITMILGGLWHGAAWHYVVWGAFHGTGLVISKDWHDFVSKVSVLARWRQTALWHWCGVFLTLMFLFVAGTLFRAANMPDTFAMLHKLVSISPSDRLSQQFMVSTVPISLIAYLSFLAVRSLISSPRLILTSMLQPLLAWWDSSRPARLIAYASVAVIILAFAPGKLAPFIYFQF
jgi:D-alanyl-lipoteichoic acid acyltransferase DltB (MBOAT superfamily)